MYQLMAVSGLLLFSFLPLQVTAKAQKECLPAGDDKEIFHCLNSKRPPMKCEDTHDHEECQSWAKRGECRNNPGFMIKGCKQSCGVCLDLHAGEVQVAPYAATRRAVLDRLVDTRDYIYTAIETNPTAFRKCKNGKPCRCESYFCASKLLSCG